MKVVFGSTRTDKGRVSTVIGRDGSSEAVAALRELTLPNGDKASVVPRSIVNSAKNAANRILSGLPAIQDDRIPR